LNDERSEITDRELATTMTISNLITLWRSPWVLWALFIFFAALTVAVQFVDVKPYPNMLRDYVIFVACSGGAAVVFFYLPFARYMTPENNSGQLLIIYP
jgi:hypothetical protein